MAGGNGGLDPGRDTWVGPTMFARIGVMRALNHGKPDPKIVPPRKRAKAYRIVR